MNEIGEKYLPIGTVAMLKDGTKRVMITGFCSASQEQPDKVWDYTGCPYPEGYISSNQTCLFDHDQIKEIYHVGLKEDAEEKEFKEALNKLIETMNNMPEQAKPAEAVNETPQVIPLPSEPSE